MSFLTPLFLAGALAIGLPILFHLIRRSTRERTVFSSLMFLHPSPPRLSKRSRLEHILLLLLRCTAVILLALGFARPFLKSVFPESQSAGPAGKTVVLLDTSASMRRANLWAAARQKAEGIAGQAALGDKVALCTFDRQLKPLLSFAEWSATPVGDRAGLAHNRLADVRPGWGSTRLDAALMQAADMLVEGEPGGFAGRRRVVVITDLQEGSDLRALQGHEWPKGVEVGVERIVPRGGNNAGIQLVTDTSDSDYAAETTVRVRVNNASDSRREQFQAGWAGAEGAFLSKPVEVYVPPGQSRVIAVPAPGTNVLANRILLKGDDEPFDNTIFVIPPESVQATVLYLGSDNETDSRQPLFFLRRALQQTRRQRVRVVAHQPTALFPAGELESATLVVVTDTLPENQAGALREAVLMGKTLLFAPTGAAAATVLETVIGGEQWGLDETRPANYAMLSSIEFRHPVFAPFADPRFSDFTKIHFWKYRKIVTGSAGLPAGDLKVSQGKVLAQFDTGDPAMLEVPLGKGRVILLAAGWHPADSQLALSSKFVPLLYSLLEYSGAAAPAPQQYFVGAPVTVSSATTVELPDRSTIPLKAGATNFSETLMPGIYSVLAGSAPQRFAVNLEAAESRTAPHPADELERLGVPAAQPARIGGLEAGRKVRLQNAELEARQKLWRWFIVATLAVLALETWLAGRAARVSSIREEGAT